MSEPENDEATAAPEAKPQKGKSKLLLMVPVFILLMGGGAGAWWYFNKPAPEEAAGEHAEEGEEAGPKGMVPLESFIVNLADPGGRKYLRANILILVADETEAKEVEENKLIISRVRSAVIEVLAKRTSTELLTPEGRAVLKKDIAETAAALTHVDVHDVLFEEFIVQ